MDELERIAADAAGGDPLAAAALVRATQSDVWRLCAALGDRGSADDLTQETYLRAFGSLHRFEGRSSVRTWLLSIARRVCADAVRSRRRRRLTLVRDDADLEALAAGTAAADAVAEGAARRRPAGPARPRPPRGVRAHPAAGAALRRGRRGGRLPGRHHPLPRGPGPRRPRRRPSPE